jgi:hypothetical protein
VQRDEIHVAPGAYFREDILVPSDGGVWQATVTVLDGGTPVDVYILATTDLALGYPRGSFAPIEGRENVTYASLLWRPSDRGGAYSLVVDNLDNGRPEDALPAGPVTVQLTRTAPLRANPEAAAALGAGTSLCAGALAFGAVGVALYLKRRPRVAADGDFPEQGPRFEVQVEVPPRPRSTLEREFRGEEP